MFIINIYIYIIIRIIIIIIIYIYVYVLKTHYKSIWIYIVKYMYLHDYIYTFTYIYCIIMYNYIYMFKGIWIEKRKELKGFQEGVWPRIWQSRDLTISGKSAHNCGTQNQCLPFGIWMLNLVYRGLQIVQRGCHGLFLLARAVLDLTIWVKLRK